MEQKSYKLEAVDILAKNENHVRGIAKLLCVNHMTIQRKIEELLEENIVDFRQEGKNKTFFLKKTEESRIYLIIAEQYKLLKLMRNHGHLRKLISDIQNNKDVRMALIFGSYAKGLAKKDSDIDLFVDSKKIDIKKELKQSDPRVSVKMGKYDKKNPLIKEIEKNHVIIKGVELFYEKSKFFE